MASIPDIPDTSPSFSTIGNPIVPVSDRRVASYDAGLPQAALAKLGGETEGMANDWMAKQNEIAKAQALSNTFSDVIAAQKQAELEPDPEKAQQAYADAKKQSIQQNSALIPGLFARQEYQASVGAHMQWMDKAFDQNQIEKQKQAGMAAIDQTTQNSVDAYSQMNNPEGRAALLQQHQVYLTSMKNTGILSPVQFQQKTKDFAKQASLAYYELHPDELAPDLMKRLGTESVPPPGIAPTVQDVSTAILGHESGGNPNAPTSAKGAVGIGQIIPATFQQYAKPGESIVNTQDNLAVHQRIINDYMQRFNGDASRVAVAYISGPGNVAPAGSPTPWVKDLNDGNENVSDYVSAVNKRLGVTPQLVAQNDNKTGKPIDNIPPYEALQVAQSAEARGNIVGKIQEQQVKQKQEGIMNDYLTKGLKGEPTSDIADDKTLTFEQREKVLTALNNVARNGDKTDGNTFNQVFQRIHARDNDPNKISDPESLVPLVGHGISFEDYGRLRKEIEGNATPDGKAEGTMKSTLLKNVEGQLITYPHDQDGQEKFGAYQAWFLPAYEKARAGGKTPDQLLNPDSPDYMGKASAAFDRPQAQRLADRLKDPMQYQAPVRTPEDVRADFKAGKISREAAKNELTGFGYQ